MRRFPGLAFRGDGAARRAWIIGTSLDVWQIGEACRDFTSVEAMAQTSDLDERQIRLALAYREHYPAEVDAAIAENARTLDELQRLYPFLEFAEPE